MLFAAPPPSADTGEAASRLPRIQDSPGPPRGQGQPSARLGSGRHALSLALDEAVRSEGGVCEQSRAEAAVGKGGGPDGALPICNFPHGGSDRVRGGLCGRGLGGLPGAIGEPLQVSRVEGPGLHEPVRAESHAGGP